MAHSRPSTVRSNTSASNVLNSSPPSKSPGRQHQRRKSGQLVISERKASRPATLNRRTTPQFITKVGAGWSGGKNMGKSDRDSRNFDEDDSRLSGEGFLQYCASCEKQINPHESFSMLYCSEACRKQDLHPNTSTSYNPSYNSYNPPSQMSPPLSPYSKYPPFDSLDSGPDIIPQFSPTQSTSRPRSYFHSAPLNHRPHSNSPPSPKSDRYLYKSTTTTSSSAETSKTMKRLSGSSTALASLRELAVALPHTRDSRRNSRDRDGSSPTASTSSISSPPTPLSNSGTAGGGVWNYLPRTLSMASMYSRDIVSASQAERYPAGGSPGGGPGGGGGGGNSYNGGGGGYGDYHQYSVKPQLLPPITLGGMDRPLPPRSGGYGIGGRPKSVDLVTPISYI